MLPDVALADIHGQHKFNFRHAAISRDESKRLLDLAFVRDFQRNGPSIYRICRTLLEGWRRYKHYPDARVVRRFEWEVRQLRTAYAAVLWAMERRLRAGNLAVSQKVRDLRLQLEAEFGWTARWFARCAGPLLWWTAAREARRLAAGRCYEPPTVIERRNWASG
jgi:hypothetical protein